MSMRLVPSATLERICVSPRVNSAEPWTRGEMSTSHSIGRISSSARPSGRFLSIAIRRRMMSFSSLSKARETSARRSGSVSRPSPARRRTAPAPPPRPPSRHPVARASRGSASPRRAWRRARRGSAREAPGSTFGSSTSSFSLPALSRSSSIVATDLLDLAVGDVEGVEDLGLADAVSAALDHQDRLLGARDDEVHLQVLVALLAGLITKSPSSLPIRTAPTWVGTGICDIGHRGGGPVHRQDVVRVLVVHRQRLADDLGLEVPSLGEQRPHRPVDHPRGQRGLLAGATLAAEEGAGDLPGRVVALLDIHRQRQEVDVAQVADGRGASTIVSPERTTTAPPAWRASLPVSKEISSPPTSTETRLTSNMLMYYLPFGRPDGGQSLQNFSFSFGERCYRASPAVSRLDARRRPSRNAAGVPRPRRGFRPGSHGERARRAPSERRSRSKRSTSSPSARTPPIGAGRPSSPGRHRSSPRAPRTPPRRPVAPRPRRRHGGQARADACWPPGSGGRRGAAAAPRGCCAQIAAQCGHARSRYRISLPPSPRTWSSGPTGDAALVSGGQAARSGR